MILSHSKMRVYVLLHLFVDYGNLSEPPALSLIELMSPRNPHNDLDK